MRQTSPQLGSPALREASGQSLISVMMGMALAGGLVLVVAAISNMGSRATASAKQGADYNEVVRTISTTLNQPSLCKCNLAPQSGSSHPFTFSSASAGTAVFGLGTGFGELRLYNSTCSTSGAPLVQATASPSPGALWIKNLDLTGFTRIDDNNYAATIHLVAQRTGTASTILTKDFPVMLRTTTTAGVVEIVDCNASNAPHIEGANYVTGSTCPGTLSSGAFCNSAFIKHITFSKPFASVPHIVVVGRPDSSSTYCPCCLGAYDQANAWAENITTTGFDVRTSLSPSTGDCSPYDGQSTQMAFDWLAVGD